MNTRRLPSIVILVLMLLALPQVFCGVPRQATSPTMGQDAIAIGVAQTLAAQPSATTPPATEETPEETEPEPQVTQEPEETQPVELGTPYLSVSLDTNCREGPSKDYKRVGFLLPGQVASVYGRNDISTWWYIENPREPGEFCWLWGEYASVEGDLTAVAIITPPPPPVPVAACGSDEYDFYMLPHAWSCNNSQPNVLTLTREDYYLTICYEWTSESNICRTGVPAGDWEYGGTATLLGISLPIDLIVYEGKTKVANFGSGPVEVDSLRLQIWLDSYYEDYSAVDIPDEILTEVKQILETFELVE